MKVAMLVVPAAMFLAFAGAFFGVVLARLVWAEESTHAATMKARYQEIHETDQRTMKMMQETIDLMKQR